MTFLIYRSSTTAVTATAKEEAISDGLNLFCFIRFWPDCLMEGSLLPVDPTAAQGAMIRVFRGVLCAADPLLTTRSSTSNLESHTSLDGLWLQR